MPTDLEILKVLEKELGIELREIKGEVRVNKTGCKIDGNQNVVGLSLFSAGLSELPPEIGQLQNLTELKLWGNQLSALPPEIGQLQNLTKLNLWGNQLSALPPEIVQLQNLTTLDLGENPLKQPPPEIVKQGIEAIRSYFESLEGDKQALNEVKVLLVGDGGAGKTSVVKQLSGEEFDKNESQTHGINIRDWNVEENGIRINVHFWDFGGQEIMHATHQFFLSKRSLYILVLDGRKEEKTEYWLKHIESFGGGSPILVVLNKMDENPGFDLNRKFLKEKYKGIRGFYPVSCANGAGIENFSRNLSAALATVEILETSWAKSWFNVKTHLEKITKDFISYSEYKAFCASENITEKSAQDTLVEYLNDLGVILHFEELELLDTHVLNPRWVTNAVYKIINSEKLALCNGVLRMNYLNEILKKKGDGDYHYPPEKYSYIIDLMKKFELCFEIDGRTVLIPDLLEVQEPEFDFGYDTSLKFLIEYDFLPKSVMPRFIVKMHKDIKENLRWRTGVVLEDQAFHSTAVIKADERDEKIYIYVNGEQKRDYFAVILFTFREINRSFEKLKAIEKVPMPGEPEITVSYEHLIRLEKMGIDEYIPDGSEKKYNVKDLLGTIYVEKRNEEEILEILRKLRDVSDTEESLLKKANDIFILQPNFMGLGINLNKLIKIVLSKK
jgi:internalin A